MDSLIPQSSEESFKLVEEVDKPGEIETDLVVENICQILLHRVPVWMMWRIHLNWLTNLLKQHFYNSIVNK